MKIAFLFMSGTKGFGGHHVSTREIMNGIRELGHECILLSFGRVPSRVFTDDKSSMSFQVSPVSIVQRKRIRETLKSGSFDAFFAMDETSCRILLSVYPESLSKLVPVKPGWINVRSWINRTSDFICFSKENFDYMRSLPKYNKVNVHLIPNRVSTVIPDEVRINHFKQKYGIGDNERIILAVSRIDPDKTKVFYSAKQLSDCLLSCGINNRLFVIGTVSSNETLSQLNTSCFEIVNDSYFTTNVSQLFSMAYAVVGMGRTAMESLSQGIPTYIPLNNDTVPVLINDKSFEYLLQSNFTYRVNMPSEILASNLSNCLSLDDNYLLVAKDSKTLFDKYLDVSVGVKEYLKIAESQSRNTSSLFNNLRSCLFSNMRWVGCTILARRKN